MNNYALVMKVSLVSIAGLLVAACPSSDDSADTGNSGATAGDGADDGGDDGGIPDGTNGDDGNNDATDGPDDGADDDPDDGADDGGDPIAGYCEIGETVGHFDVILEETYSAIDGEVRESLVQMAVLTVAAEEAGCLLVKTEFPFCNPPCSGGDACTDNGCVAFPPRIELGTVEITGLEAEAVMEPASDKRYFKTDLPHPAITPGANIELDVNGGKYSGFNMQGAGFGPLVATSGDLTLAAGTPVDITWDAENGEAMVRIELNIDQHGTSPSTLFCNVEDNGSFSVPATVIDALIDAGTSGFPSANLYRQTVDSTDTDTGCVEFRIRARTEATINVEGHTPCNMPGDCPEGEICNVPIQTCE